jgi:hypothetical protein
MAPFKTGCPTFNVVISRGRRIGIARATASSVIRVHLWLVLVGISDGLQWFGIELDDELNRLHTGGREGSIGKEAPISYSF